MNEDSLFSGALAFDDPAERLAYLRACCGEDSDLFLRVAGLLELHGEPGILDFPPMGREAGGSTRPHVPAGSTVSATTRVQAPRTEADLPRTIGKFRVESRLGVGGQGSAYLARDPDLDRQVVLKRYHEESGPTENLVAREGQALARIRSRFTCACYGMERDGDEVFLVMEYIPGRCLAQVVNEERCSPDLAVRLIEQLAEGLATIHTCGFVHRDIKPSNIILGEDGVPRLVDFGLAAHLGSDALRVLAGSPAYMAPEQARGHWDRIDARTDLYALGGVLYALLTGRPPHPGKTRMESLLHAKDGEVDPPRDLNPLIPGSIAAACRKALEPDPSRRFGSAIEMRAALSRCRHRRVRRAAIGAFASVILLLVVAALWPLRATPAPMQTPEQRPSAPAAPGISQVRGGVLEANPPPKEALAPAPALPNHRLSGELSVRVWTPGGKGKLGSSVDDRATLPVVRGERVQLRVTLAEPAYVYLLWIDGQGNVQPLYPWPDRTFGSLPTAGPLTREVRSPERLDEGWPMEGPDGLETALLLIRSTPLSQDDAASLAALIGRLPPSPVANDQEFALLGVDPSDAASSVFVARNRGLGKTAQKIDDPLLKLIERLRPRFEMIRAVRFAYRDR